VSFRTQSTGEMTNPMTIGVYYIQDARLCAPRGVFENDLCALVLVG